MSILKKKFSNKVKIASDKIETQKKLFFVRKIWDQSIMMLGKN